MGATLNMFKGNLDQAVFLFLFLPFFNQGQSFQTTEIILICSLFECSDLNYENVCCAAA